MCRWVQSKEKSPLMPRTCGQSLRLHSRIMQIKDCPPPEPTRPATRSQGVAGSWPATQRNTTRYYTARRLWIAYLAASGRQVGRQLSCGQAHKKTSGPIGPLVVVANPLDVCGLLFAKQDEVGAA